MFVVVNLGEELKSPPLPLLEEIEICRTHIRISPTIILQTTEVLSQASRGIRLRELGWLKRSHIKAIQLHLLYGDCMGGKCRW